MKVFNLNGDEWDRTEERPGWRSKDAGVGARIGAELIGGSMYELEPGDRLWPYHTHHANEEWLVVLLGRPTLRTHEGQRTLSEGDVVCFPRGKEGAHQVSNHTGSAIRVLMLSTLIKPDIVEYLDSGKIGARSIKGERILLSRPGPSWTTGTARTRRQPSNQRLAGWSRSAPSRRRARPRAPGRSPVGFGPERKSTSTRPTRPAPNSM